MYITFEGADGTGKTTHAKLLADRLSVVGKKTLLTKEPGTTYDPVCRKIREILLDKENRISTLSSLFLFLADRAQHMDIVAEALADDLGVLSDRSSISTFVYYTAATYSPGDTIDYSICPLLDAAQLIRPSVAFMFSADPEWSMNQIYARGGADRIESMGNEFHSNVHTLFQEQHVRQLLENLTTGPKECIYVPETSSHTVAEISDFIFDHVVERFCLQ